MSRFRKKYKVIICKNHPRANIQGNVFEHILIAEKALGINI